MKLLTGNSNKHLSVKLSKYLKTKLVNSNWQKIKFVKLVINESNVEC